MADDHTTSPVSDAMVLKIMAERERDLGFTVYADWLDAGCPDKGADDQWEYPQEKIDDVRFYIVAMKAKEEAADPVDSEVKNIVSNWHSFKGQTADQPSADEIERVANDLAVKVTEHAIMELDADEENTAQIEAFGTLVEQEFRSALSAIRNTPQVIEAGEVDWSKAERGKFYRPSEETLARIGEAAEGAVLSEMTWQEIGEVVLEALRHPLSTQGEGARDG